MAKMSFNGLNKDLHFEEVDWSKDGERNARSVRLENRLGQHSVCKDPGILTYRQWTSKYESLLSFSSENKVENLEYRKKAANHRVFLGTCL